MSFPTNIYILSAIVAAGVSFGLLPAIRQWCLRTNLVDDPGHRKIHHTPIPLAGGFAVLAGLLLPCLAVYGAWKLGALSQETQTMLRYALENRFSQLAVIMAGALGMVLLGWWDDRHELKPGPKFAAQLLVAGMVAAAGIRITLFVPSLLFSVAITILWILTLINAFNFMDNMNGLCTGLGVIGAVFFGVNAAWQGQSMAASLAFLSAGALLGFLPYNFPKASAFLGDAGSHLVGYMMAVLSILPSYYSPQNPIKLAVVSPLLILAVPLLDMAWVVLLRWKMGKPFYVGDTNHLSHRLTKRGLSRTKAVAMIWLLALAIAALSLFFH